jgi:hypothetical protein
MKPPVTESIKCTQFIRNIPLENFRLAGDGRKWQQAARTRKNFLIYLSTWANGDGTFIGANGIDYSPSEKTITRHMNRKTYYRVSEALQQLGLLSWTRKQTHYGRRSFTIHLENHLPDSPRTGDLFKSEQVTYSPRTGDLFAGTHPHDGAVITHPHDGTQSVFPNTAPANAENSHPLAADAGTPETSALPITGAAVADALSDAAAAIAVRPKQPPAGHLPSVQTTGGQAGTLREPAGDEQHADVDFEIDPMTPETAKQAKKQSQKEYAIEQSKKFRALPQQVQDQVNRLRQRCRAEWDYWSTHDRLGDAIMDEEDYRLPVFPSPKSGDLLKLVELLERYTESQILGAWKKFLNRAKGFDELIAVWANFFLEFDDYVEVREPAGAGVAS